MPEAMPTIVQLLLLIVGALLTVMTTLAVVMVTRLQRMVDILAGEIRSIRETLSGHMLGVARDYVTHEQLDRHCRDRHLHGVPTPGV